MKIIEKIVEQIRTKLAPSRFGKYRTNKQYMSEYCIQPAERYKVTFPNGYGASIIRNEHSYGGRDGLFEVAVVGKDDALCYDTPITSDVEGYLSRKEVSAMLAKIEELAILEA